MEVVDSRLAQRRVATAIVEPGADSALDLLDDRLVLVLDAIEIAASAAATLARIEHQRAVHDARAIDGERHDDVDGKAPGIEVQHRVGEEEEIESGDRGAVERVGGRGGL